MKTLLMSALAVIGLGLTACTSESTSESTTEEAGGTQATVPEAGKVSFKIDGMT